MQAVRLGLDGSSCPDTPQAASAIVAAGCRPIAWPPSPRPGIDLAAAGPPAADHEAAARRPAYRARRTALWRPATQSESPIDAHRRGSARPACGLQSIGGIGAARGAGVVSAPRAGGTGCSVRGVQYRGVRGPRGADALSRPGRAERRQQPSVKPPVTGDFPRQNQYQRRQQKHGICAG